MSEVEWLESGSPLHMMDYLEAVGLANERRLRLLGVACCRQVEAWFIDPAQYTAVEALEQYAMGLGTAQELAERTRAVCEIDGRHPAFHEPRTATNDDALDAAFHAVYVVQFAVHQDSPGGFPPSYHRSLLDTIRHTVETAGFGAVARDHVNGRALPAQAEVRKTLANIIRDIFGNPFRPVVFDSSWLTSDVLALARQMYESRDFSAMPILADALQDAGCDNEDILNHCRQPGEHVRGCWVVDLLTGRK